MSDGNVKAAKTLFVTIPDDDVLMLLRDFLEPLGYKVEYASEVKGQRPRQVVKGAAGALLFLMLENMETGLQVCTQFSHG